MTFQERTIRALAMKHALRTIIAKWPEATPADIERLACWMIDTGCLFADREVAPQAAAEQIIEEARIQDLVPAWV